jgi:hypothetical protein
MKQIKLLTLLLLTAFVTQAQSVKLKWKQIQTGTTGQVAIVGVNGEGQWVTPPFLNLSDTATMLAAYQAAIADLQANKEDKSNKSTSTSLGTSNTLYPTQNAVKVYVDNANSTQDAATATALALKEDVANKSTSTTLGTSNTLYPSQNAVKAYVDNQNASQNTTIAATYVPLAGATMTGPLILSADPSSNLGAATKQYVDNIAAGISWKKSVDAASTANITVSAPGFTTLDGVTLTSGSSRILLKDQTTQSQNGIYQYNGSASALTRTTDMDVWAEVPGAAVFVEAGTTLAKTGWVVGGVSNTGTIGTTSIPWTQFTGAGTYSVSSPITLTGNVIGHANSGVTAGTYNNVTVNAQGHVTAGSNTAYLTAETDPIFAASAAYGITSTDKTNWTNAYNKKVVSLAVTGGTTKTFTATLQDGSTLTATWSDLQSQWTDVAQQFTGSTSNSITLSNAPSTSKHLTVSLNGQILTAADYSVTGTTLTLANVNREASDYIIVYYAY